jgi:thioredoxin 1
MSEKELDSKNFDEVIGGDRPVFVDFYATWCGPCQMMMPVIEELAKEAEDFTVAKLDIDQAPEVAAKYNVMSVPTFILFKDGKEAARMMGAMPKDLILEKIKAGMK